MILFALVLVLPSTPIDPWNFLNLKKIATMIFALVLIQFIGVSFSRLLGPKTGAILTGFLGGLVSSTATTASLARRSQVTQDDHVRSEVLTYLAATAAMLLEGALMVLVGTNELHFSLFIIFLGPFLITMVMLILQSKKTVNDGLDLEANLFQLLPILKLAGFIFLTLALSKLLQVFLGQYGLLILTFLVSLFEIHGSIIANIQLHDSGVLDVQGLGNFLAVSVTASYVSKMILVLVLGRAELRSRVFARTALLLFSIGCSWLLFRMIMAYPVKT